MESESVVPPEQPGCLTRLSYTTNQDHAGLRLDHFLVLVLANLSRSQISNSIKSGAILINGTPAKAGRKLHAGDVISGFIEEQEVLSVAPQKVDFPILYEDEHLLMLSKPPGVVVHPASGNPDETLVNGLLYHCATIAAVGDPVRPGIVHRLDKDTTGVMVVAKNNHTHRLLVEAFKARTITKKYVAIVCGIPTETKKRIVAPIGRHPVKRKKMAIRHKSGKFAATNWYCVKKLGKAHALLDITLETGRTHQIRVHLASIGHPVAGDNTYGSKKLDPLFTRQMLHSSEISFIHPVTGKKLSAKARLWQDMADVIEKLESQEWAK